MLKIKASKTTLQVLTGTAVLLFIGCVFLYFNRAARLDEMDHQLEKAQSVLSDNQQVVKQLDDIESSYRSAHTKLDVLESGVSKKAYIPTLLKQLEELGRENNLTVVAVRPKSPDAPTAATGSKDASASTTSAKDAPPYDKINVDIEVNGSYNSAVHFLQALTSFPKIIAVNNVQITPLTNEKNMGMAPLSVRFSTTAFIMKEQDDDDETEESRNPGSQPSKT
jgi:Tfp pilus assembly protein PilO